MKKLLSLILAAIILAACLSSCALPTAQRGAFGANIRLTSSDAADAAAWLTAHLGDKLTDRVVLGTEAGGYGVDVSALENDGYFIRSLGSEVALFARTADGLDRAARKYAKMVEAGAVADATYHEGYRVKSLTIAGNDISEYAIVCADDAGETLSLACSELSEFIERACGTKLPIFSESEYRAAVAKPDRRIVITEGDEALGLEGFSISIGEDGTLSIEGGVYRGALFGVYDLLEDIGWRFTGGGGNCVQKNWLPADKQEYLYEAKRVDLTSALDRTETPSIPIRGVGGRVGSTRDLRPNKNTYQAGNRDGAPVRCCHGLQNNHSLIFSGDYEGLYPGANVTGKQPCFTDENILEAIDHYALEYVRTRLDAGQTIGKEIIDVDVAQWDTSPSAFCTCKSCTAVQKVEGNRTGAYLRMANRVAALLDENYPGMCASILAYNGTDELPAVTRPAHNLFVAFCFYVGDNHASCHNHCISGEECTGGFITNKIPAERFKEWANVMDGSMIQVWIYPSVCLNTCYNAPIYMTLIENVRFLASYGVGHVYIDSRWTNNGLINEELSVYLMLKCEWDATITDEEYLDIMREWYRIVYGEESGDLLFELAMFAERAGDLAGCWSAFHKTSDRVDYDFVSRYVGDIWKMCDRAVASAESAAEKELIEKNAAGYLYMAIRSCYDEMYVNGTQAQRETVAARYREVWKLFDKYSLAAYGYIASETPAPAEFDPDLHPGKWIHS